MKTIVRDIYRNGIIKENYNSEENLVFFSIIL